MRFSPAIVFSLVAALAPLSAAAPADAMITAAPTTGPIDSSCFTWTTSEYPKTCPWPEGCVVLPCVQLVTQTVPCPDLRCPVTPTVTDVLPCTTTCREGCAVSTTTVTPEICPL